MKTDVRAFQDDQDIAAADRLVVQPEADHGGSSCGLFHGLEGERRKLGPERLGIP